MKHILLALCLMITPLFGVTYIVENNLGSDSHKFTDNNGNFLTGTGGSAAFGYFDISDSEISSSASVSHLLDNFNSFGDSETNFLTPTFPLFLEGIVSSQGNVTGSDYDAFAGQSIYFFVGNGATLADSEEIFIYKFDVTFAANDSASVITITLDDNYISENILVGGTGDGTFTTSSLGAVPEPSSLALIGLGAVGFIIRRRK